MLQLEVSFLSDSMLALLSAGSVHAWLEHWAGLNIRIRKGLGHVQDMS